MLGYLCAKCAEIIFIAKPGEKRDCPNCGCKAHETDRKPS